MGKPMTLKPGSLHIAASDAAKLRAGKLPKQLFFEAVLARPERNRNGDVLTPEYLTEVAATLAHTPIDDEHKQHVLQGSILDAHYDATAKSQGGKVGALIFSGVTWPGRFPDIALGLLEGTIKFSVEAGGDEVACTACGSVFATTAQETDYCACLQARRASGSQVGRAWKGGKGLGAAFTREPAGSECEVLPGSLTLVASYDEDDSPDEVAGMLTASVFAGAITAPKAETTKENRMTPEKIADLVAGLVKATLEGGEYTVKEADEAAVIAAVKPHLASLAAKVKEAATLASAELAATEKTALEATFAAEKTELAASHARALTAEKRVNAMSGLVEDPEQKRDLVASMSDEQWEFALSGFKASAAKVPPAETPAAPAAGAGLLAGSAKPDAGANPTAGDQGSDRSKDAGTPASLTGWSLKLAPVAPAK